jgi:heterodisulfide reductase subunit A
MAIVPNPAGGELFRKLGIRTDEYGFVTEANPDLSPLETSVPGIFVTGMAQGPKDIPDSVSQASGAACKVLALFAANKPEPSGVAGR